MNDDAIAFVQIQAEMSKGWMNDWSFRPTLGRHMTSDLVTLGRGGGGGGSVSVTCSHRVTCS